MRQLSLSAKDYYALGLTIVMSALVIYTRVGSAL